MKQIKRNLARINHLFEVYDGYKRKRNPLLISSDLIIQEPLKSEVSLKNDKKIELVSQDAPKYLSKCLATNTTSTKNQSMPPKKDLATTLVIQEVSLTKVVPNNECIVDSK